MCLNYIRRKLSPDWLISDKLISDWLVSVWLVSDWLISVWLISDWLISVWLISGWLDCIDRFYFVEVQMHRFPPFDSSRLLHVTNNLVFSGLSLAIDYFRLGLALKILHAIVLVTNSFFSHLYRLHMRLLVMQGNSL